MALKPDDAYLWARNQNRQGAPHGDLRYMYNVHAGGGYLMGVDVSDLGHLKGWLAAREAPGDRLFCNGNCMEWLGNAVTGPDGLMLFHDLGLKRSMDGPNMKAKLLHGANARLRAVGVTVHSVAEFEAMSDADLLGPAPAAGVEEAIR
jgi:hypothetical protein